MPAGYFIEAQRIDLKFDSYRKQDRDDDMKHGFRVRFILSLGRFSLCYCVIVMTRQPLNFRSITQARSEDGYVFVYFRMKSMPSRDIGKG
ncbi:uncharacterized protein ACLA_058630 [Aspergillus clavatus NRRL 1]|uniref:Uncharacterized protein n=1 Tax=Aspergillus clavatus (strain ATCC 1007 / CBS 513.65 / DSM 816 / NCTC 3887 / NRRL 1 / QM 1276 / 107) TaxID=344612 RepID=A1C461_ASPCL|nr:uncharacterized protein ACLA_058630 [Aspergillus clavatus NRRL 1]EAW15201.1 hypothetical protein ACLA_058630 [Aspergillus clavatus NRRL 1]